MALTIKLVVGLSLITVSEGQLVTSCSTNQECADSHGFGSCCLYFENLNTISRKSFTCKEKSYVDYYLLSESYDHIT